MIRTAFLFTGLLLGSAALSANHRPIYQAGSQYTAVLNTRNAQWHMVPRVRRDFVTPRDESCPTSVAIPAGLWLLTRDANGNPELLAPSHTTLPNGHSGHIPIIGCNELGEGLAIPANILEWLNGNTGAIYVE